MCVSAVPLASEDPTSVVGETIRYHDAGEDDVTHLHHTVIVACREEVGHNTFDAVDNCS